MLRTLCTIGSIAGFIACAFVPPTDANFESLEQMAKSQVQQRTNMSRASLQALDLKKAKTIASTAKKDTLPVVRSTARKITAKTATTVATPDAKTVLQRVSAVAVHAVRAHKFSAKWKTTKEESGKERVLQLQRIEWASRKQDVRLCGEVRGDTATTVGEYRALCVAIVTGDPARCDQLRGMKDVCANELATL